tara:strand:+ start:319 stop:663 length:345 start_codon:yes stop_codon:yes gene_type:complete
LIKNFFLKYVLFLVIIFLTNCDSFKRFDQEKYSCSENKLSISDITILKTNAIKKAFVTMLGNEFEVDITSSNKKEIVLSFNDIYIVIDKDIKEISVNLENKILFLSCEVANFNI